jgi:regulatory protein
MKRNPPPKPLKGPSSKSALTATMDHLARRDHSELELRKKLSRKYGEDEIEQAIAHCREHNWLASPESLSERATNALHRRQKGILYIQRYLRAKGLPAPAADPAVELEKARTLVQRRFGRRDQREKAHRFLKSRGFEDDVIRKVLYANDRT